MYILFLVYFASLYERLFLVMPCVLLMKMPLGDPNKHVCIYQQPTLEYKHYVGIFVRITTT
jgi:hypothetical protein